VLLFVCVIDTLCDSFTILQDTLVLI